MTSASSAGPGSRARPGRRLNSGTTYVLVFVAALFLLPSVVVLAGPLKSNGSPAVVLAVGAFVLVVFNFLVGRREGVTSSAGALTLIASGVLFLITWAQGQTRQLDALVQASTVRSIVGLAAYTGIALLIVGYVRTEAQRFAVVIAVVVGLVYSGLVGLGQGFLSKDYRYLLRPPGFTLNRDFAPQIRGGFVRVLGTTDSPIEFAVLMACLLALSLYLVRGTRRLAVRVLGGLGIVVAAVGIPASVSRTGAVTLFVVVIVYAVASSLRMIGVGLSVFALILLVFAVADPTRFDELVNLFANASSDDSITGRTDDYAVVGQTFLQYPWLGTGLGTNPPSATRFLDNQWLQAVVQGGVTGVAATALLFGAAFWAPVGLVARRRRDVEGRSEAVAYLAATGAIFASSFTFDLFGFQQAKFVFFVLFGLGWSAHRELVHGRAAEPRPFEESMSG